MIGNRVSYSDTFLQRVYFLARHVIVAHCHFPLLPVYRRAREVLGQVYKLSGFRARHESAWHSVSSLLHDVHRLPFAFDDSLQRVDLGIGYLFPELPDLKTAKLDFLVLLLEFYLKY